MVSNYRLWLVGGCSDGLVRFWILPSGGMFLSQKTPNARNVLPVADDCLSLVDLNQESNKLVGAFESGMVKVWSLNCEVLLEALMLDDSLGPRRPVYKTKQRVVLQIETQWRAHLSRLITSRNTMLNY